MPKGLSVLAQEGKRRFKREVLNYLQSGSTSVPGVNQSSMVRAALGGVGGIAAGALAGAVAQRLMRGGKVKAAARQSRSVGTASMTGVSAPSATSFSTRRIGLSDIKAHTISWVAGSIYVGQTSTLGQDYGIYFRCSGSNSVVVPIAADAQAVGCVPVSPGDAQVGSTFGQQLLSMYARKVVKRAKLLLQPLMPSTSLDMMVAVAGARGAYSIGSPSAGAVGPNALTNIMTMKGVKSAASWQPLELDLTPFIAGGSGARQDEFDTQMGFNSNTVMGAGSVYGRNVIPCTFAVGGNCNDSSLLNKATHLAIIELNIDLIDFVGSGGTQYVALPAPPLLTGGGCKVEVESDGKDEKDPPKSVSSGTAVVPYVVSAVPTSSILLKQGYFDKAGKKPGAS